MSDNEKPLSTSSERIIRIFSALMDESLSPELRFRMQEWFRNSARDQEKQEVFRMYSERFKPVSGQLTGDALIRYNKLAARLDLPQFQESDSIKSNRTIKYRFRTSILFRVAATLIPAAILIASLFTFRDSNKQAATEKWVAIRTADSVKIIELPDGSRITLYENSGITYPKKYPEDRSLTLDGKARFNIEKFEDRPFSVRGGELKVTVLGTEFFMTSAENNPVAEVALVSGVVSITGREIDEVTIMPGQQFTYDSMHNTFEVRDYNQAHLLRLADDGIEFSGHSLGEVLELLAAYFGLQLQIMAAIDLSAPIRLKFDKGISSEEAFRVVSIASGQFKYALEENTVKILPAR